MSPTAFFRCRIASAMVSGVCRASARKVALPLTLMLTALFAGCRLTNMEPLEVVGWSPQDRRVTEAGDIEAILVEFSSDADQTRTERAFTLTEDDTALTGRFSWEERTMRFVPDLPIESGRDYRITITGDAQDVHGNALGQDFEHVFTTRVSDTRPTLVKSIPHNDAILPVEGAAITLDFGEQVDRASFYEALDISPSILFSVSWNDSDSTATVHTMETLTQQQEYTVRLDTRLENIDGNTLAEAVELSFHAEQPGIKPALNAVRASHEPAPDTWRADYTDEPLTARHYSAEIGEASVRPTAEWERFWGLALEFNTPVRRQDIIRAIEFDPEISFSVVPEFQSTSGLFEILPDERFEYDREYTLRLAGDIRTDLGVETRIDRFVRFRVDGAASRPPAVGSVFFLENPKTENVVGPLRDDDELDLSEYGEGGDTGFFDLYVTPGTGARFDPLELASAFSFSVDNVAADFELVNVLATDTGGQTNLEPQPAAEPANDEMIIRVHAVIEDLENSGVITVSIDGSARDSYDNALGRTWQRRLNQVSSR